MRKKVILKGPILTRSGYGEQCRFALRALRSQPDIFDVFILPIQWGTTSWVNHYDEEKEWIDQCIEKTIGYIGQGGQFDISIQTTIPNEFEAMAPVNIGYTAGIETNKVAPEWIEKANQMDKTIVVSRHSQQVFKNCSYMAKNSQTGESRQLFLAKPVEFVNYPVKDFSNVSPIELDLKHDFNFLCVAQFGPRKNIPDTLQWFVEEFHDEQIGLVVKSNRTRNCLADRESTFFAFKQILSKYPNRKCTVHLLHGDMSDAEMHALYTHEEIKAFVCLSHGEGFGLPFFESAYSALPVIAPGYSGQNDFLFNEEKKECFYNVAFDMQPVGKESVWKGVIPEDAQWAFPREVSAKENMRRCYEDVINNTGHASRTDEYATALKERFSKEEMYKQFCEHVAPMSAEESEWHSSLSQIEIL
tara:strand:- start:10349 stop:11596 length:1248 start_codon:yes stop_codon:yes gene_type:complete